MTVAEILADHCTETHRCPNAKLLRSEFEAAMDEWAHGNGSRREAERLRRLLTEHVRECEPIR